MESDKNNNIAPPEVSKELNLLHSRGKTLTGYTYKDEEDGIEKVGFVGKYNDTYYYLKQSKIKGENWIKCNNEELAKFQNEMNINPPQSKLL